MTGPEGIPAPASAQDWTPTNQDWPLVSVVVPTKDRPELLRRAVRAILDQEYAGEIECIVVFDQEQTHVPEVPTGPGRSLRIEHNGRTPGLAGGRNTGYLLAKGELMAACDDDDEWLPGKLRAQVELLARHPEASLISTGILIHYDGRDIPRDATPEPLAFRDFLRDRRMEVHPSTYLARRDAVIDGFGLVNEEIPGGYAEDYEWLLRAARSGPVLSVPQRLVRVHWHSASFFTSRWQMIDQALTWLLEEVPEFVEEPRGLGRIEGQLAFANAAMGRRRLAFGYASRALRHYPANRQAWASLPVSAGLIKADQVVSFGRRLGRGVDPPRAAPLPQRPELVLPAWPIWVLFAGFPVLWVLGLGAFASVICAIPMIALLYGRGRVSVPLGFAFWVLFVLWVGIAMVEIDTGPRLVGYGVRLSNYLGATVLFVYAYNLKQEQLPTRKALAALAVFFGFVVVGGWLGVLFPNGSLTTPVSLILPGSIGSNAYVQALVHPNFAEVQQPFGAPKAFSRPSAPFPYTNGWGCNVSLLVPCMVAAIASLRRRSKVMIMLAMGLALVPAFATLNRGMFLAIGVGVAYAAVRLAMKGRVVPLVGLMITVTIGVGVALASGVLASLQERLTYSQTNVSRTTIYSEAFRGAVASPLLGNGAPRPSQTLNISVGTQGQIWNVMFSYGFLALFFFLAWFAWVAFVSRHWETSGDLWLHVCLVVAFMTTFYYGYDGPQLTVLMLVAALAVRRVRSPSDPAAARTPVPLGLTA